MDEPQIFFFIFIGPWSGLKLTETSYVNQNSLVLWGDAFRRGGPFSKAKIWIGVTISGEMVVMICPLLAFQIFLCHA